MAIKNSFSLEAALEKINGLAFFIWKEDKKLLKHKRLTLAGFFFPEEYDYGYKACYLEDQVQSHPI